MSIHNPCFEQRLETNTNTQKNCSNEVVLMTEKETTINLGHYLNLIHEAVLMISLNSRSVQQSETIS